MQNLRLKKKQSKHHNKKNFIDQYGLRLFLKRYDDFVTLDCELNFHVFDEPASFQEAVTSDVWKSAMQREYDALIKKWNLEVGGPSNWNQTYWMQVDI